MLWFGIGSLFMTFAGLTSAFIVSKNREDWVQNFDLPEAFYYSLIFILSSSIILIFARRLLIKNQQKKSFSTIINHNIIRNLIYSIPIFRFWSNNG
jgi:cytochrome c oxidase subunit 3